MKRSEKKIIFVLIIITIVVAIVKINKEKKENNNPVEKSSASQQDIVQNVESDVKKCESEKLQDAKVFGEFEMSNIQLVEENELATLTASVKNNSNEDKKEFAFKIKLLNKNGEVLQTLGAYLGDTKAGESRGINASINMDISEVYDLEVEM